ncbi:hypothetical protein B0A48_06336 [Cryoendolithus antarcticus]|uniref:Uncharacterized protein n=1 Tax=Cryoendolithus antarcticus TaxID=1507870 RepID=A0A1V8TAP8_9PEZI|nr:hypothetical protein B0A48_06336 [Cryoendolithus antarcticus]
MLSNAIIASAILASAPLAHAIGSAIVVNGCNYPVKLCNVPSANGGYQEIDETLEPNGTYTQQWTELTNGNGWSIKLSPDQTLNHIMQYEYTFHNDGTIWYDLSEVDGNPWNGNWEITAEGSCTPKQSAYRYSTDDAYGMQACPDDSTITVLLCSGESQNDGSVSSIASSGYSATPTSTVAASSAESSVVVATTTPAAPAPTSTEAPVAPVASTTSTSRRSWRTRQRVADTPTTLATIASTTTAAAGNVVVVTEVVTEVATATAYAKRHEHHAHPHARA